MVELKFDFPGLTPDKARKAAEELQRQITSRVDGLETHFEKRDSNSQDAGSILAIVLGSGAITVLAEHIGVALVTVAGRFSSSVDLVKPDGTRIQIKGDAASSAAEILAQID